MHSLVLEVKNKYTDCEYDYEEVELFDWCCVDYVVKVFDGYHRGNTNEYYKWSQNILEDVLCDDNKELTYGSNICFDKEKIKTYFENKFDKLQELFNDYNCEDFIDSHSIKSYEIGCCLEGDKGGMRIAYEGCVYVLDEFLRSVLRHSNEDLYVGRVFDYHY